MKAASYGLIGLGVIVLILGLVNHYVLKPPLNFVPHTSTVILAVGVVLAIIGAVLLFLGGGSSSSAN